MGTGNCNGWWDGDDLRDGEGTAATGKTPPTYTKSAQASRPYDYGIISVSLKRPHWNILTDP